MAGPARRTEEVSHARVHHQGREPAGALADLAEALGERGINISGVAGSAWDDSGAIGLITNDDAGTRSALDEREADYREMELVAAGDGGQARDARRRLRAGWRTVA